MHVCQHIDCKYGPGRSYEDNGMQQFDKQFVVTLTIWNRDMVTHFVSCSCIASTVISGFSRYMDLHGSQCPVRTCLWEGCQSWAHNRAQGTPRCSKERWGQQEGAKRHTRSLKTEISKYPQTYHMNGPSESSDLYICISVKPVGLSIYHLGHANQINRATARPMLLAVVGMGAKRTMPWRSKCGKANRTTMKHCQLWQLCQSLGVNARLQVTVKGSVFTACMTAWSKGDTKAGALEMLKHAVNLIYYDIICWLIYMML